MNTYYVRVSVFTTEFVSLLLTVRALTEREAEVEGIRRGLAVGAIMAVAVWPLAC